MKYIIKADNDFYLIYKHIIRIINNLFCFSSNKKIFVININLKITINVVIIKV